MHLAYRPATLVRSTRRSHFFWSNTVTYSILIDDGEAGLVCQWGCDSWGGIGEDGTLVGGMRPIGPAAMARSVAQNFVPGAHYSGLAQQAFSAGSYIQAAGYFAASLADAGLAVGTGGLTKAGGSAAAALLAVRPLKPINLPSWRSVSIDMDHILPRHTAGGPFSAGRSTFPEVMNERGIEGAIRDAYRYSERIGGEGDRILLQGWSDRLTIEMWLNRATKTIETAYPVGRP